MSASAVFILDLKGKVLIARNYRGDIPMSEIDHFMPLITEVFGILFSLTLDPF